METHGLVCHSDRPAKSVQAVEVQITRCAGQLAATYVAVSKAGSILIPPPAAQPCRKDELWKTTCFEAFVRGKDGESYYEFNFAPSGDWAAYSFVGYRNGMRAAPLDAPSMDVSPNPYRLEMTVIADLPVFSPAVRWPIALSAIIEETDGTQSYWALSHPSGAPDFHHPACFNAFLPAPHNT